MPGPLDEKTESEMASAFFAAFDRVWQDYLQCKMPLPQREHVNNALTRDLDGNGDQEDAEEAETMKDDVIDVTRAGDEPELEQLISSFCDRDSSPSSSREEVKGKEEFEEVGSLQVQDPDTKTEEGEFQEPEISEELPQDSLTVEATESLEKTDIPLEDATIPSFCIELSPASEPQEEQLCNEDIEDNDNGTPEALADNSLETDADFDDNDNGDEGAETPKVDVTSPLRFPSPLSSQAKVQEKEEVEEVASLQDSDAKTNTTTTKEEEFQEPEISEELPQDSLTEKDDIPLGDATSPSFCVELSSPSEPQEGQLCEADVELLDLLSSIIENNGTPEALAANFLEADAGLDDNEDEEVEEDVTEEAEMPQVDVTSPFRDPSPSSSREEVRGKEVFEEVGSLQDFDAEKEEFQEPEISEELPQDSLTDRTDIPLVYATSPFFTGERTPAQAQFASNPQIEKEDICQADSKETGNPEGATSNLVPPRKTESVLTLVLNDNGDEEVVIEEAEMPEVDEISVARAEDEHELVQLISTLCDPSPSSTREEVKGKEEFEEAGSLQNPDAETREFQEPEISEELPQDSLTGEATKLLEETDIALGDATSPFLWAPAQAPFASNPQTENEDFEEVLSRQDTDARTEQEEFQQPLIFEELPQDSFTEKTDIALGDATSPFLWALAQTPFASNPQTEKEDICNADSKENEIPGSKLTAQHSSLFIYSLGDGTSPSFCVDFSPASEPQGEQLCKPDIDDKGTPEALAAKPLEADAGLDGNGDEEDVKEEGEKKEIDMIGDTRPEDEHEFQLISPVLVPSQSSSREEVKGKEEVEEVGSLQDSDEKTDTTTTDEEEFEEPLISEELRQDSLTEKDDIPLEDATTPSFCVELSPASEPQDEELCKADIIEDNGAQDTLEALSANPLQELSPATESQEDQLYKADIEDNGTPETLATNLLETDADLDGNGDEEDVTEEAEMPKVDVIDVPSPVRVSSPAFSQEEVKEKEDVEEVGSLQDSDAETEEEEFEEPLIFGELPQDSFTGEPTKSKFHSSPLNNDEEDVTEEAEMLKVDVIGVTRAEDEPGLVQLISPVHVRVPSTSYSREEVKGKEEFEEVGSLQESDATTEEEEEFHEISEELPQDSLTEKTDIPLGDATSPFFFGEWAPAQAPFPSNPQTEQEDKICQAGSKEDASTSTLNPLKSESGLTPARKRSAIVAVLTLPFRAVASLFRRK